MVKVCEKTFPLGSYKRQKSVGFYMNSILKDNLDPIAEKIGDDMFFTLIITGSGMIRVGKSVFAQQIGRYLTEKVNEIYKINNQFTLDNIFFKGRDLVEKALKVPKYSVLILDEGDDLTAHYWTKLASDLRRFFRKCGQLNLILILILPDFFELPRPYAITRSICLMDVHFVGKFERGFFKFYNFKKKRELYLKGKRIANYEIVGADFDGRFVNAYTINEQEYKAKKQKDLEEQDLEEKSPSQIIKETKIELFKKVYANVQIKVKKLVEIFGISRKTRYNWLNTEEE